MKEIRLAHRARRAYDEKPMILRTIPVLALLVLFISAPVIACEAMERDAESSAAPMDMAGGCTDDAAPGGPPVLCPASAMIAPGPQVELPRDLVAGVSNLLASATYRFESELPVSARSAPRPPGEVPLYKIHAAYLI